MTTGALWERLTTNALAIVTVAGVTLYVLLRLPYSIYYGRLGTAPEDVGLTYVELLARSTVGVAAILLVVVLSAAVLAFLLSMFRFYAKLGRGVTVSRDMFRLEVFRRPEQCTDEQWQRNRARIERLFTDVYRMPGADIARYLSLLDIRRALLRRASPSDAERVVAKDYEDQAAAILRPLMREAAWGRARQFAIGSAVVTFVGLILVLLPLVGLVEADRVRDCDRPRSEGVGLLAIRGAPVTLSLMGDTGTSTALLTERDLRYLGRADDVVVLFDCRNDETVRVPAAGLLVVSKT